MPSDPGLARDGLEQPRRPEPTPLERLTAGKSRLDYEAEQDSRYRQLAAALAVLGLLGLVGYALHIVFAAAGRDLGPWGILAFVPALLWSLLSASARRPLRPRELDRLGPLSRAGTASAVLALLWLLWSRWSEPVGAAWAREGAGWDGVAGGGLDFPLRALLEAAPLWLGAVAGLWLLFAMILAPAPRGTRSAGPPDGAPEP